jgi:phage/plasmid primase-like uncharacterized protein
MSTPRVLQFRGRLDERLVEEARDTPIDEVASRLGLDLRREGQELVGACPVCGGVDRFGVSRPKNVWHCRGCQQGGDGIELVRHVEGRGFVEAVEFITGRSARQRREHDPAAAAERERKRREQREKEAADEAQKTQYALNTWEAGKCIYGTPAATYLKSRHCDGMFPFDRDAVFRFHAHCVFGDERLPCLLTLLRDIATDEPRAIVRTALTSDGRKIGRMVLGPCAGAAVKLWPTSAVGKLLVVGEGTETALSAALHLKMAPAWATVSAVGLESLQPIPGVEQLVVLVDRDENGRGQRAAETCSLAWTLAGKTVCRLTPKIIGHDANDVVAAGIAP